MKKYEILENIFISNREEVKAKSMEKYMKNKFAFYGIDSKKRREITITLIKENKARKVIDWELLDAAYKAKHREFQYSANDYLLMMQKCLTIKDIPKLTKYAQTKEWWDTIDALSKIIRNIGLQDRDVNDIMLIQSKSNDIWLKRIAIIHQNGRKEKTDEILLKKIIEGCFDTNEFFINKAIGWALREYSKTNPE